MLGFLHDKLNTDYNHLLWSFLLVILLINGAFAQSEIQTSKDYRALNLQLEEARLKNSHEDLAQAYLELAEYEESQLFDSQKSFDNYTNSLTYYKLIGDTIRINKIQEKIAERQSSAGLYIEAKTNYDNLLKYYKSKDDKKSELRILSLLIDLTKMRGDLEGQATYMNQAFRLNKEVNDSVYQINFLLDKSDYYKSFGELDSAIMTSLRAFYLSNDLAHKEYKSESLYNIGFINFLQNDFERAIKYLKSSLDFRAITPYDEGRRDIYNQLSACYNSGEDYENALLYKERYSALNDSILNKDRLESINKLQIRYQTLEKNKNIQQLENEKKYAQERNSRQRTAVYVLLAASLILLVLIYYIIQFYRQRINTSTIINEKNEEIAAQRIRELEDSVKIGSMKSMIEGEEKERERVAKDLHDSLGGLLSAIKLQFDSVRAKRADLKGVKEYNKANKLLDVAVTEVRTISQNMQPSALNKLGLVAAIRDLISRFDDEHYPEIDFQHYDVPDNLDPSVSLSIYRIIQELVNNSIKHARAEEILLQINVESNELVIQFEDDGLGFDNKKVVRGMGLDNINSRVKYLKGEMEMDSQPGHGTSYLIRLHIEV